MSGSKDKQISKNVPVFGKLLSFMKRRLNPKRNRHYDPPSVWLNALLDDNKVQIVQIGSNDGLTGDPIHELIKSNQKWNALFVEPIPYLFERLRKNYGNDPRFTFENVAINDGTKQVFYSVKAEAKKELPNLPDWYDQIGSFQKENIIKHLDGVLEPYIEELLLSGITLEELFKRNNLLDISLLHIDAEGYDWKILSQLNLDEIKPKVILVEHKHLVQADKHHLINFLKNDYILFRLGADILGITKDHSNKNKIQGLTGEPLG